MGSKDSTTTQTNSPPAWAEPLLKKGASEAMNLYDKGAGYQTYTGPTQAQFSPTTLQGMNNLLAATGGGTPITNESVFNNPAIQQARQQLTTQAQQKAAQPAPAPAQAQGAWITQKVGERRTGGREGEMVPVYAQVNTLTGERRATPMDAKIPGRLW